MRVLFALILLYGSDAFAQSSFVSGVVTVQNSQYHTGKAQYLPGVRVSDSLRRATAIKTNAQGRFTMEYKQARNLTPVQLDVFYNGYEVVNWHVLSAITGSNTLVRIAMTTPHQIATLRAQLYKVDIPKILQPLQKMIEVNRRKIALLSKNESKNEHQIADLQRKNYALAEKNMQLEKEALAVAGVYERVNLDDQEQSFKQSYHYFTKGNFDSCARIIDQYNLYVSFAQWELIRDNRLNKRRVEDSLSNIDLESLANMTELKALRFEYAGQFDSAENNIRVLIHADTARAQSWKLLGDFYSYVHADPEAGEAYNKAVMLTHHNDLYLLYQICLNLGMVSIRQQDMFSGMQLVLMAQQFREKSANVKPYTYEQDIAVTYAAVAFSQLTQGNVDTLLKWLNKAYALQLKIKDSANANYTRTAAKMTRDIAIVYLRKKDFQQAQSWLDHSIRWLKKYTQSDNPEWLDELSAVLFIQSTALFEQKRYDEAEKILKEAIDLIADISKIQPQKFWSKRIGFHNLLAKINLHHGKSRLAAKDLRLIVAETLANIRGNEGVAFFLLSESYDNLSKAEVQMHMYDSAGMHLDSAVHYRTLLAQTGEISHVKFLMDKFKEAIQFFAQYGPVESEAKYKRLQSAMDFWAHRKNFIANKISAADIEELMKLLIENE